MIEIDEDWLKRQKKNILRGQVILLFVIIVIFFSVGGFCAGWKTCESDVARAKAIESAAVRNELQYEIKRLRAQTASQGDSLAALWRCYTSLAGKVWNK
jgi:hypothetical protein